LMKETMSKKGTDFGASVTGELPHVSRRGE
jgi:hypothetical protein